MQVQELQAQSRSRQAQTHAPTRERASMSGYGSEFEWSRRRTRRGDTARAPRSAWCRTWREIRQTASARARRTDRRAAAREGGQRSGEGWGAQRRSGE
eukprot:6205086-Pleurochrysis_carterae.AAC.8